MKRKTKRIVNRVVSGIIMCGLGILFLIAEFADKSMEVILPLLCFALGALSFIRIAYDEKGLYFPDKQPTAKMCRKIEKAYNKHRKDNSERKPVEQELQPVGNPILNKQKFIDGINKLISGTGLSRDEFDEDYNSGEVFRSIRAMLNIGKKYVTYSNQRGNQYIIRSRDIIQVYPVTEYIDMYSYGVYVNTYQDFYIVIVTPDSTYKFFIEDYMDRPVIDAFRRIYPYLHYECEIYKYPYPAVSP
ncbi:MAG: hypothetical protein J5997_10125 [Oscillospiraceae bacterium]|nr:hypothetical protein [Oscillospiraceae bacterium]